MKLRYSSVLPAWYDAAEIPFWFKKPAIWSAVLLCVANKRIEVRFLYESDFKSVINALVLLLSLVIESCKFRRDRSGWVIKCSGYYMSKSSQICF